MPARFACLESRCSGKVLSGNRFGIPKSADDQLFVPTVRDDVAFGPTNLGLDREAVETRVRRAVTATGVGRLMEKAPHHLSGGEKRMVAIAGVLAMEPRLLFMMSRHPILDIRYRRRVINFFGQSRETLLIASHDLEFILDPAAGWFCWIMGGSLPNGNPG
jgi:cobalt/nickel transport system ATP-binding protein